MGLTRQIQSALGLGGIGRKNFQGDLFGRFQGLDPLFRDARGRSVLDLGMSEGHIAYEFARAGAAHVHGIEQHRDKVRFAERLFRDVAIDTRFLRGNLAVSGAVFRERYGSRLLTRYDTVLFLGVYHHLKKEMKASDLDSLVDVIAALASSRLAVRSDALPEFEGRILDAGFVLDYEAPKEAIGLLRVYRNAAP